MVAIARLDYFARLPGQIHADRYLIWPCLFWLGTFLFLAAQTRHGPRMARTGMLLLAALVAWALLPTHACWSGWGEAVYRNNAATAAAVRSDVFDTRLLVRDDPSVALREKLKSLSLFRERGLAMFARPGPQWLGQTAPFDVGQLPQAGLELWARDVIDDDLREGTWPEALRVQGVILSRLEGTTARGELVVLDDGNQVAGFGERSFTRYSNSRLRQMVRGLLPQYGFDAYIRAFDPTRAYRLVVVDTDFAQARMIGVLHQAQVPAAP